jgi:hypothetical protein
VPLAVVAVLAVATSVSAVPPTWTTAQTLRTSSDVSLDDADFSNRNVAIAWTEPDSPREVRIRTSVDSGSAFGPTSVFGGSRQAAVEVCGGAELNAVMAHKFGPGNWFIEHAQGSIDGDGFLTTPVAPSDGIQKNPDVACAGGRLFVSWFEEEGSGDRMFVAHGRRTGGGFSNPIDLGFDSDTFFGGELVVAGVGDTAYAAFTRTGGDLRLMRWSVGSGPGFAVAPIDETIIDDATRNDPAADVVIAAAGDKVAVAWSRCDAVYGRVSNDRGDTWGPIRELVGHAACGGDFFASPSSIAISGSRIAVAYLFAGIPNAGGVGLIRTMNNFVNFSDDTIKDSFDFEHLIGFLTVSGQTRLGAAFQPDDSRVRFRRQT